jgi:hypothetical protein
VPTLATSCNANPLLQKSDFFLLFANKMLPKKPQKASNNPRLTGYQATALTTHHICYMSGLTIDGYVQGQANF